MPQLQRLNADERILKVIAHAPHPLQDEDVLWLAESNWEIEAISRLLHYTTMHQIRRYIASKKLQRYEARDWVDYLEMANLLGYDIKNEFVIFPKDLKKSHDEAMGLIQLDPKVYDRAITERYEHLKRLYFYKNDQFMIVPPRNAQELIDEGQKLHHCVGNYARKMAMGQCQIFFIRRLEDPFKPYYTLELDGSEVVQCRGFANKEYDSEMEQFIGKWRFKKVVSALQHAWESSEAAA